MKRVSFEVAKALKEAGYPQDYIETWYYGDKKIHHIDDPYVESITRLFRAPTYIEVWLWLWREKKIYLNTDTTKKDIVCIYWDSTIIHEIKDMKIADPEEAIVIAIEYLVTNNLIE